MFSYHDRLKEVISSNKLRIDTGIDLLVREILSRRTPRKNIWLIGNGGSASNAEHFETDISFIRHDEISELPMVSALTSNSALVTAASNDTSYEDIFKVLIKRKARKGDLLVSISASGNSQNVVNGILQAKIQGVTTFSLLGFDGGKAKFISDQSLVVSTNFGEYGIVEDVHLSILHAVSVGILRKMSQ